MSRSAVAKTTSDQIYMYVTRETLSTSCSQNRLNTLNCIIALPLKMLKLWQELFPADFNSAKYISYVSYKNRFMFAVQIGALR